MTIGFGYNGDGVGVEVVIQRGRLKNEVLGTFEGIRKSSKKFKKVRKNPKKRINIYSNDEMGSKLGSIRFENGKESDPLN
jgi:hypothetical protein